MSNYQAPAKHPKYRFFVSSLLVGVNLSGALWCVAVGYPFGCMLNILALVCSLELLRLRSLKGGKS